MLARIPFLSAYRGKSLVGLAARCKSTTADACKFDPKILGNIQIDPSIPRPVRQEPGKVRLGLIPEEWFQFFYKKTGVTGPYTFGIALSTYLVSKEWYVLEHEYYNGLSVLLLCVLVVKKLGPSIAKYVDKEIDEYEAGWNSGRATIRLCLEEQVKNEEENQWSLDGQLMLTQAKRENIALQYEAAYRRHLMEAYTLVKMRLDYQTEIQNIQRRFAHKHLVNWVVKSVLSSITPDQEKQNINKCIADLSMLAKV